MEQMIVLNDCNMKNIDHKMPKKYNMIVTVKIELFIQIHLVNPCILFSKHTLPLAPVELYLAGFIKKEFPLQSIVVMLIDDTRILANEI